MSSVEAQQAAMRLLATREHTQLELRNKLQRTHAEVDIERALKFLQEQGLQSDDRFTELYVVLRRNKGYGPLRIRAELQKKGVDEIIIGIHVDENDKCWASLLQQVAEKKYAGRSPVDRKEIARRGRFLSYRGFPSDLVNAYLSDGLERIT